MRRVSFLLLALLLASETALGGEMEDDPLLAMLLLNKFEVRVTDSDTPLVWDAEAWVGKDLNKLWMRADGWYGDGQVGDMELQLLYSRAISPFWDLQAGWRGDIRPEPERNWLTLGVQGLSPYYFDVEFFVFVGENGRTALRVKLEYEFMLTQRLVLTPEVEVNLYGKDDPALGIGSGLSESEVGLRLRYEIRREFAPYVGVNWTRSYGDTADYSQMDGDSADDVQLVLGLRTWF